MNCDRAKMYYSLPRLQWCWAHLKRDFQALIDSGDGGKKRLGHDLMRPTRKLFRLWARYRDGTLTRVGFQRLMKPIRQEIDALLLRGAFAGSRHGRGTVEPSRLAVDLRGRRRASNRRTTPANAPCGTPSSGGSCPSAPKAPAAAASSKRCSPSIETCRQQSRNLFAFITAAVDAHFAHHPAPSLAGV